MIYLLEDKNLVSNLNDCVLDGLTTSDLIADIQRLRETGKIGKGTTDDFFVVVNSVVYDVLTTLGEYLLMEFRALPETILAFGSKPNVKEITRQDFDLIIMNKLQSQESQENKRIHNEGDEQRTQLLGEKLEEKVATERFKSRKIPNRVETDSSDEYFEGDNS